ncbi:MAG: Phosphotransferase enzyme family protein [Chlorobi bacterium]|nr:Phosphotransferase enzyme family protein [Chlorobiota bacterium]
MKSQLLSLYQQRFGHRPEAIIDLRAHGSNRKLFRLIDQDGTSVVGVFGPDHEENRAFLSYSRALRSVGLPVPEIHIADEAQGLYLEEDLGDITLFDALAAARNGDEFPPDVLEHYRRVVDLLPVVQVDGGRAIDYSVAYPSAEFDRRSMAWDLNYFKYHFLKLAGIPFNEARLQSDFERLCDFLLTADRSHFLYRDFQSRNIMLRGGEPWLIDYQGGRRGALQYDIASLLYDAKADLPEPLREELLGRYMDALADRVAFDRDRFVEEYRGYVLIRILQALGAYGYRGFFERKPLFLASVPYAIRNIERVLERGLPVDLPELRMVFERIAASDLRDPGMVATVGNAPVAEGLPEATAAVVEDDGLTVTVRSFSYRRGYPAENSEHGGGFVFDCRSLHNPGRYEPYKALCGLDAEVVEFLEREESVEAFWDGVRALVDGAVRAYMERGFSNVSVAFGCTGGQHRSVYFAERLSRHLRKEYPTVRVVLEHREKERWPARR